MTDAQQSPEARDTEPQALTVAGVGVTRYEEHLDVGVQSFVTGVARLEKYMVTTEQTVSVGVCHEEVRVVWEPAESSAQRAVDDTTTPRNRGSVVLYAEHIVVTKHWVPVQRAHLDVTTKTSTHTVTDTLATEHIDLTTHSHTGGDEHAVHRRRDEPAAEDEAHRDRHTDTGDTGA